jgi:membrane-bound ClpP family serine protease
VTHFTFNPDLSLILLTMGVFGISAEFLHPGRVIPGVAGAVAVLIGLTGFSHPDPVGLALLACALTLLLLEALHPSRGILKAVAAVLMPCGALRINPAIHVATALLTMVPLSLTLGFLFSAAMRARRNKKLSC